MDGWPTLPISQRRTSYLGGASGAVAGRAGRRVRVIIHRAARPGGGEAGGRGRAKSSAVFQVVCQNLLELGSYIEFLVKNAEIPRKIGF